MLPKSKIGYKIKLQSASLSFRSQSSLAPTPGAWFEYQGERFKVLRAEVVDGGGNAGLIISEDLTIACGEKVEYSEIQRQGRDK